MKTKLPLEGVRVIDLTMMLMGPLATAILGDLGAEVIRIEKPGEGDPVRGATTIRHRSNILSTGRGHTFEIGHRNKKGIAVNLLHPGGKEVLYRLVAKSDALLSNLLPPSLRRMGADKETVQKYNPNLIYVHGGGYGPRGPESEYACQDIAGMGRSGFSFNQADDDGEPVNFNGGLVDIMGGTMLAFGAVTALFARERTGTAQGVATSQLGATMWLAQVCVGQYANRGETFPPFDRKDPVNPLINYYKCADGKWIALANTWDKYWHDFCEVTGLQHLEHDPRYDLDGKRIERRGEMVAILDTVFATKRRAEWEALFRQKDLQFSVVNHYSDLPNDPQVVANEYIRTLDNGVKVVAPPFEMEGVRFPEVGAPEHGQHTEEVLENVCGYTWDEITDLREKGTIW